MEGVDGGPPGRRDAPALARHARRRRVRMGRRGHRAAARTSGSSGARPAGFTNAGVVTFLQLDERDHAHHDRRPTSTTRGADADEERVRGDLQRFTGMVARREAQPSARRASTATSSRAAGTDPIAASRAGSPSLGHRPPADARGRGRELLRPPHVRPARPPRSARRCRAPACRRWRSSAERSCRSGCGTRPSSVPGAPTSSTAPSARTTSGSGWPPHATVTRGGERARGPGARRRSCRSARRRRPDCWTIASLSQRRIALGERRRTAAARIV